MVKLIDTAKFSQRKATTMDDEKLISLDESYELKKLELLTRVNHAINDSRKLELISKMNQAKKLELNCQIEEFFNKCHDAEGLFCPGVASGKAVIDAAKPKTANRSWIDKPGKQQMVTVYHEATRAGSHIDVHLGPLSMVYRVKPELQEKLKFNSGGQLTKESKTHILNHIKGEIQNRSRVPQNLDHSLNEARTSWVKGDPADKSYGAGKSRQIVDESTVDVYKTSKNGPIEFYAPSLNPDRGMYIHKLYPGDDKRAPILIWGNKTAKPPKFEDRLHLKTIPPEDIAKLDGMHTTVKYDGASAYVSIGPKGTTIWSPRTRKKTGEQIEYTPKLGGIGGIKSDENITGMGELLFTKKGRKGYLSAAETGGILNSHKLLPDDVKPEIRLYRVDKVGRKSTKDLSYTENRALQERVSKLSPTHFKVAESVTPKAAKERGLEGVVAVPESKSVNQGYKLKWRDLTHDWRIDNVAFKPGDRGGLAGVTHLTSLDSGKQYKLGPGQMGNHTLVKHMMENPHDYTGSVVKVHSHHGHEGRSSKVIDFHMDKGVAPPKLPEAH